MELRLLTEIDSLKTDIMVMSKKLESKSQAVSILLESLDKCRTERNEFRRMAEQVMSRYQLLRKAVNHGVSVDDNLSHLNNKQLVSLLIESREANRSLETELIHLRQRLNEAYGDIELLRKQLNSASPKGDTSIRRPETDSEKEQMVFQMERLTAQLAALEHELSLCSDEKNEAIAERDLYRNKCDRLNNELDYILNGNQKKLTDISTLLAEKKSLIDRLEATEKEKMLAMATLTKYQRMFHRSPSNASSASANSEAPFSPNGSPNGKDRMVSRSVE